MFSFSQRFDVVPIKATSCRAAVPWARPITTSSGRSGAGGLACWVHLLGRHHRGGLRLSWPAGPRTAGRAQGLGRTAGIRGMLLVGMQIPGEGRVFFLDFSSLCIGVLCTYVASRCLYLGIPHTVKMGNCMSVSKPSIKLPTSRCG